MDKKSKTAYPFETLPDYLASDLDVVFIGINPGTYSVRQGHYFARKTSRFWPAISASRLSERMRLALGITRLLPEHDSLLPLFGIGLTDVIKRPTANASELSPREFKEWAPVLFEKLSKLRPRVACFHGLTGFRPFARIVLGDDTTPQLGAQPHCIASTRLFVVPNPSPANAHFTLADQIAWYDRLADFVDGNSF